MAGPWVQPLGTRITLPQVRQRGFLFFLVLLVRVVLFLLPLAEVATGHLQWRPWECGSRNKLQRGCDAKRVLSGAPPENRDIHVSIEPKAFASDASTRRKMMKSRTLQPLRWTLHVISGIGMGLVLLGTAYAGRQVLRRPREVLVPGSGRLTVAVT